MTPTTRNSEYLVLRATGEASSEWFVVKAGIEAPSREAALNTYLAGLTGADGEASAEGTYVVLLASSWIQKTVKPKTGFEIA